MRSCLIILALTSAASLWALDRPDVEYGKADGTQLLLDLHIPDGSGPFPAAILVHGGGFDQGSKSTNVRPLFSPLAQAGYAWFSIDYRLAPKAHFQDSLKDVMTAIKWVKDHASEYHVDTSRIALIGESAGGFLVNYAGTHLTSATQVAVVVDFYGPSDYAALALLRQQYPERFNMVSIRKHAENGGGIHFFGIDQLDDAGIQKLRSLAPLSAVHPGMPPFLCIHGNKDDQVNYDQTPPFCAAIQKAGSACSIITIEGGGHGMSTWKDASMQHWKPEMIAWLNKTMHSRAQS